MENSNGGIGGKETSITDDDYNELYRYDITPARVRFSVPIPDGTKTFEIPAEQWAELSRQFDAIIHKARPITDNDLPHILPTISNLRDWHGMPLATLVNLAKMANGTSYILRIYEPGQDREWNVTTWGEFEAMQAAVRRSR